MELALYNGVAAALGADGEHFFYANPLASRGQTHRQPWFKVACCPPNVARLLASLGQYVYSLEQDRLLVHLYVARHHRAAGGRSDGSWCGRTTSTRGTAACDSISSPSVREHSACRCVCRAGVATPRWPSTARPSRSTHTSRTATCGSRAPGTVAIDRARPADAGRAGLRASRGGRERWAGCLAARPDRLLSGRCRQRRAAAHHRAAAQRALQRSLRRGLPGRCRDAAAPTRSRPSAAGWNGACIARSSPSGWRRHAAGGGAVRRAGTTARRARCRSGLRETSLTSR